MRTVLHLVDVGELIRLSRPSYWGRSMHTISSGPTRDPTYSHPPINHWPLPSELWFLRVPSGFFPSSVLFGALRGHNHFHMSSRCLKINCSRDKI